MEIREKIPWARPDYWGNERLYVNEALDSTWISGGEFVNRLESDFQSFLKRKHILAVSNGTTALHLAYLALNIKQGDEIIIPGFCYLAAANIALQLGAKPVFAEVDFDTWCLDPIDTESKITRKTKAIVAVHTYGNVCDMDALQSISSTHQVPIIEDCAESLFSTYKGIQSGCFGLISTYSFQATKTITTGEGGLVVTDNDQLAEKMKLYRSHGMDRSKAVYWHELPGHNFRLTNLQAALGVAQMEKADKIIKRRINVYNHYKKYLGNRDGIYLQKFNHEVDPLIWAVAVRLDGDYFEYDRDQIIVKLAEKGIEMRPGFYSSNLLDIYDRHDVPVCENISKNIVSFPSYPTLEKKQIEYICNSFLELMNKV